MNGKEIVSKFLAAEAKQDVQGMGDVLAENIVFEMPFAFPGLPDRVEGKGTLVEFGALPRHTHQSDTLGVTS